MNASRTPLPDTPVPAHGHPPAYAVDGQTVPPEHFYAVACDPARHVAVEACAGAGKTWMLVSRILRALLAGAEPQQILAITFTKKAAAEMQQRLSEWLETFAALPVEALVPELELRGLSARQAQEQAPHLQTLYIRLIRQGRAVQIRTFHAWFAALLRVAPLQVLQELGLPSHYTLLEDDAPAVAETWQPFHAALLQDPEALRDYQELVALHGRSQIHKALEAALSKRTEFMLADAQGVVAASVPHFSERVPELKSYRHPAEALATEAARQRWSLRAQILGQEKSAKTPVKAAQMVVDAFALDDADTGERFRMLRKTFFVASEDRLTRNLQKYQEAVEAEQELLLLCEAMQQHQAWEYQQRMMRLTRVLLRVYGEVKHAQGWVDMADVERAAGVLLQDEVLSGWMQERLDAQVRHLLIDEFQDTNPMQWQALHAWLSGYGGAATAPSVFIVGDPKQSIYRFRRAEPQVFRAAKDFVHEGLGGALLSCDHTRRNSQAVMATVNAVMQGLQREGAYADFRVHTTASAVAGAVGALPAVERPSVAEEPVNSETEVLWRDSLEQPRETEDEALAQKECRQLAAWVHRRIVQDHLAPGEVMILSRRNARLQDMRVALAERGIASEIASKQMLAHTPEVLDVLALVDALVSPRHDIHLARALKSPLFGLDDARLSELVAQTRPAQPESGVDIQDAGASGMQAGGRARPSSWLDWILAQEQHAASSWAPLARTLRRWQGWLSQRPPHDALDAIFRDGDLVARFVAAAPASRRQAVREHLQALPAHALQLFGGRFPSAYGWVHAMRQSVLDQTPATSQGQSVRLLTVHGAKGLEANLVVLLDSDAGKTRSQTMEVLVQWPGQDPHPRAFVFLESEKSPPPSVRCLLEQEQAEALREELNALYVAMTRARHELLLSAVVPRQPYERSWWRLLHQYDAEERLQPETQPLQDEAALLPASAAQDTAGMTGQSEVPLPVPRPLPATLRQDPMTQAMLDAQQSPELRLQSRMGQAMHKVLEWQRPGTATADGTALARILQRDYQLSLGQAEEVLQRAHRILSGEGAWAWGETIEWQANEVDLCEEGQLYRIDRLVRTRARDSAPATWWVIDYKSASQPETSQSLQEQLQQYRRMVQSLYPDAPVRAAFFTAEGRMQEVA